MYKYIYMYFMLSFFTLSILIYMHVYLFLYLHSRVFIPMFSCLYFHVLILCIFFLVLQVEGDSVTLTIEMKSGHEHSTPNKVMWGFACIVRPQETAEDSSGGLPFLLDLYLSLSSISCSLIGQQ